MKYTLLIALGLFFSTTNLQAQENEGEHWYKVDQQPAYPGGMGELFSFIRSNVKYTKDAKKARIEGKVFVSFVIDEKGVVLPDSVRVIERLGYGLDEEAIRVMKLMPTWTPGKVTKTNTNVPVRMVIPVIFKR